ncbi:MAG: YihA family ribosome biogenesis GTP-binding protein [Alphaproteobacteria bacterium]|nr:YihA family ribosome biogenesis GTP-binding protein [Alphaproteobacteria bacterium]
MGKNPGNLWKSECKFVAGASSIAQIPDSFCLNEIAFVGRSNVGKSSLLNSLVEQNCARVSKQPGRTQQINFFSLANKIMLVDLPGYGYAAVSKQTRQVWDNLILHYLTTRKNLKRVFLLIDVRRGIKDNDLEVIQLLDSIGLVYQFVLTKIDKVKNYQEVSESIREVATSHPSAYPEIICTSSEKGTGISFLKSEIIELC